MSELSGKAVPGAAAARSATHGSSARVLDWSPEAPAGTTRRRTPLSVVPATTGRRKAPFAVFCFLALVLGLATVLLLNISVSSGQYQLVQLQNERTELTQRNEALTQQVENHQAPQVLAAAASDLGMVSSGSFGTIDLENLTVSGEPEAAAAGKAPEALVPAPGVLTKPVTPPASPAEQARQDTVRAAQAQDDAARKAAESAAPAEAAAPAVPATPAVPAAPAVPEPAADPAPGANPDGTGLNGGTIPVPEQKTGH